MDQPNKAELDIPLLRRRYKAVVIWLYETPGDQQDRNLQGDVVSDELSSLRTVIDLDEKPLTWRDAVATHQEAWLVAKGWDTQLDAWHHVRPMESWVPMRAWLLELADANLLSITGFIGLEAALHDAHVLEWQKGRARVKAALDRVRSYAGMRVWLEEMDAHVRDMERHFERDMWWDYADWDLIDKQYNITMVVDSIVTACEKEKRDVC